MKKNLLLIISQVFFVAYLVLLTLCLLLGLSQVFILAAQGVVYPLALLTIVVCGFIAVKVWFRKQW